MKTRHKSTKPTVSIDTFRDADAKRDVPESRPHSRINSQ